jgi:cysteinyl-tRNA synthetase
MLGHDCCSIRTDHDLIFPHHENEIAQSTCSHGGAPLARVWMHNGFLTMDAEKMSKSLGNVALVHELVKHYPGEVLRFALLSAHYRAPLDWTSDLLEQAQKTLDRIYRALLAVADVAAEATVPAALLEALADDLNTPRAMAELSSLTRALNASSTPDEKLRAKGELLGAGALLGILQQDPAAWLGTDDRSDPEAAEIDELVAARTAARAAKDWGEADRLRDLLLARNIEVTDGRDGVTWRRLL